MQIQELKKILNTIVCKYFVIRKLFATYSDESGCFSEHYQAIGIVSGQKPFLSQLRSRLMNILTDKNMTEKKKNKV